jgi:hypothetical protein
MAKFDPTKFKLRHYLRWVHIKVVYVLCVRPRGQMSQKPVPYSP